MLPEKQMNKQVKIIIYVAVVSQYMKKRLAMIEHKGVEKKGEQKDIKAQLNEPA